MIRRAPPLAALLASLALLAGCGGAPPPAPPAPEPPPPAPQALELTGAVPSWTGGAALLEARVTPAGREEAIAEGALETSGAFRIVLPAEPPGARPLGDVLPPLPQCERATLRGAGTPILFLTRIAVRDEGGAPRGDLVASAGGAELGRVWAGGRAALEETCVFDGRAFAFDYELEPGWNALAHRAPSDPSEPFRIATVPAPTAPEWRVLTPAEASLAALRDPLARRALP